MPDYDKQDTSGLGDISLGLNYVFKQQDRIVGAFSITTPTSDKPNLNNFNSISDEFNQRAAKPMCHADVERTQLQNTEQWIEQSQKCLL